MGAESTKYVYDTRDTGDIELKEQSLREQVHQLGCFLEVNSHNTREFVDREIRFIAGRKRNLITIRSDSSGLMSYVIDSLSQFGYTVKTSTVHPGCKYFIFLVIMERVTDRAAGVADIAAGVSQRQD